LKKPRKCRATTQERPLQAVKVTDTKDSVRQLPKDKAKTSLAEKLEVRQAAQLEETATASGSESANAAQMTDEESEMLHLEEGHLLLLPAETKRLLLQMYLDALVSPSEQGMSTSRTSLLDTARSRRL